MNKIRKTAVLASLLTVIGLGMMGCDWGTPDEDNSWSDSYNWINFSGVYKNPGGGSVVSDFTSGGGTTNGGTVVAIAPTTIASGNGFDTSFSGSLIPNVVPGSVLISAGGVTFTDNGAGLLVPSSSPDTLSGTIIYSSGAWSINMGGVIVNDGQAITARYSVFQFSGGVVIPGKTSKNHGTTGVAILSLTAMQEGNLITLIDSDGRSYPGRMGSLRTASGNNTGVNPVAGDTVIAQFSVNGTSRAGIAVEIVGVFQGTITGGANGFVLTGRTIQGQWIEKVAAGRVGDVVGSAAGGSAN